MNRLQILLEQGQSVWLDDLRRDMFASDELAAWIARGVRGLTSNPTTFEQAIARGVYDQALRDIGHSERLDQEVFESLAIEDVRRACDLFRPVYEGSRRRDGYVSLEVSPLLARDTARSLEEARRLWRAVDRPNVMIKVPGTAEGCGAIEQLLFEGINVNVTLLFSVAQYEAVAKAHMRALQRRRTEGLALDAVASVASLFISRIDSTIDRLLVSRALNDGKLSGKTAIANAQLAYDSFMRLQAGADWQTLKEKGAMPQRLLWASTATKDPQYSDVKYLDALVGPHTVTTVPPKTLNAFIDHGSTAAQLPCDVESARMHLAALRRAEIELEVCAAQLEKDGIEKFAASYYSLLNAIHTKRAAVRRA